MIDAQWCQHFSSFLLNNCFSPFFLSKLSVLINQMEQLITPALSSLVCLFMQGSLNISVFMFVCVF